MAFNIELHFWALSFTVLDLASALRVLLNVWASGIIVANVSDLNALTILSNRPSALAAASGRLLLAQALMQVLYDSLFGLTIRTPPLRLGYCGFVSSLDKTCSALRGASGLLLLHHAVL